MRIRQLVLSKPATSNVHGRDFGHVSTKLAHHGNHIDTGRSREEAGVGVLVVHPVEIFRRLTHTFPRTAVSTALPTIVEHLHGSDFIWVGSAYTVASTAILPTIGALVSTIGRKRGLLTFIAFFALGSAICGSAQNLNMLIAGRVVQGIGGGGCISTAEIIYADLIPLPERGKFLGATASVWAFACAIGPPIGGALSGSNWRWLFFLNLPLCGIAFLLVILFLEDHTPHERLRSMTLSVDWIGLGCLIAGTVAMTIGLAGAGFQHPWGSKQVLVPFCIGAAAFCTLLPRNEPNDNEYIGTCIHGIVSMAAIFYTPVYFQACQLASPIRSGVDFLSVAIVVPVAGILAGVSVELSKRYRPQNCVGWVLIVVGFGLLTMLGKESKAPAYIGLQTILGSGLGIIWVSAQFAILAPLPFSNNAHALGFFIFVRCFSQTWGIVVGGTILQNTLRARLPAEFLDTFGSKAQLTYAIIPQLVSLPEELRDQVRDVFAEGMRTIWYTMLGISVMGLLSCLLMSEVKMRNALDERWELNGTDNGGRLPDGGMDTPAAEK
ncbi:iron permease [Mycena metata]|uniref:Iron permease n=1 Tax=Mycena metata TaxID=1033252 RepID=A0AAD7NR78_9AGAR|nr:iron permease [Mycena metata]